ASSPPGDIQHRVELVGAESIHALITYQYHRYTAPADTGELAAPPFGGLHVDFIVGDALGGEMGLRLFAVAAPDRRIDADFVSRMGGAAGAERGDYRWTLDGIDPHSDLLRLRVGRCTVGVVNTALRVGPLVNVGSHWQRRDER